MTTLTDVVARAEPLVRHRLGAAAQIAEVTRFRLDVAGAASYMWPVARCRLTGVSDGAPESVIVKWLRDDTHGFRTDPRQMLTERAALEFMDELGIDASPHLIASDAATSILVLEDLHPREPLSDLLNGPESEAASLGLRAFATALGDLAAGTVGHADAYYRRRRALGPVQPDRDREGRLIQDWVATSATAGEIGVPAPQEARAEMAHALDLLLHPGPFLAFSSGDPGDNNLLVHGSDGRLIDFEFAGYRHALLDGAMLHLPGPRWITMPDPVDGGLEDRYRSALVAGIPEAADDRSFSEQMAAAVMVTALGRLGSRIRLVDRRRAGDGSRAQIITTLENSARAAVHHGAMPHAADWYVDLALRLRARWPDADSLLNDLAGGPPAWTRRV